MSTKHMSDPLKPQRNKAEIKETHEMKEVEK